MPLKRALARTMASAFDDELRVKADFQSSHEAPRCKCMHEHFHPITMLNS